MTRPRFVAAAASAVALLIGIVAPAVAADAAVPRFAAVESGPVSVAVVVPFTVPVDKVGLLDAKTLETYTGPEGLLTRELNAVVGTSATIGLDPMIPASIRILGTSAPASALAWLARLRAAPNEVFMLAYADADPVAAASAGALDLLEPLDFGFAIDPARFGPASSPTPTATGSATANPTPSSTPTDTPDSGPPPLPTIAELLEWSATLEGIAWPGVGGASPAALTALVESGYSSVILDSASVSDSNRAVVREGGIDVLVSDDAISTALRAATAASNADAAATQSVLDLALSSAAARTPGSTLVATLDRGWATASSRLPSVLAGIGTLPTIHITTLASLLSGSHPAATLAKTSDVADAVAARASELSAAIRAETSYLTIASDPLVVSGPRRLAFLALLGVGWQHSAEGSAAASSAFLARSNEILGSVQIQRGNDLLVLSDSSTIRVTVSNALKTKVTVYVSAFPLRPKLHVQNTLVPITIAPDSQNNVLIPVQSITNGDVNVRMSLTSATGAEVGSPRVIKVILQAGWESIGTLIVGLVVILVFGGGLVRRILRRRRGTPGDAAPDHTDTPDDNAA
ncbi:MAG TPA: DUF6049 family protein [Pseudolysinimonas sp.]|nr:DUF6049 family protein [Pseudolysinimonas sp.]